MGRSKEVRPSLGLGHGRERSARPFATRETGEPTNLGCPSVWTVIRASAHARLGKPLLTLYLLLAVFGIVVVAVSVVAMHW